MGDRTNIEWADATWNPASGCTEVSPGCDNCYAKTLAERFRGTKGHYYETGFDVTLRPNKLTQPLRWRKPRRIFVNSMSDLFHQDIPDDYIAEVWAVMAMAPRHTFQVLTKRHGRMRSLLTSPDFRQKVAGQMTDVGDAAHDEILDPAGAPGALWPLPNVWLGVSVEDQARANLRIPSLMETPAAVRFLSCEPLLGPVDLTKWTKPHTIGCLGEDSPLWCTCGRDQDGYLDWVIVGGESGHNARVMHPNWARTLRDQCARVGIPFHFKQWGEWGLAEWKPQRLEGESVDEYKARAEAVGATHVITDITHTDLYEPDYKPWSAERAEQLDGWMTPIRRWGKKHAGRELDGRTHDEFPKAGA